MSTPQEIIAANQIIETFSTRLSFAKFGWSELATPVSMPLYEQWIQKGFHGEMNYLKEHIRFKKEPQLNLIHKDIFLNTCICFAFPYKPHPHPSTLSTPLRIASYVGAKDYHEWIKEELQIIVTALKERFPANHFLIATDSRPILERDLAARANLGWIGKNTCLIDRKLGSFFLLGEILSDLHFEIQPAPIQDFCGTCTRCIDACPTGAITEGRLLDARKCISYLTIESRELPPIELRNKIGDWFFGCDICQDVCPWNLKIQNAIPKSTQTSTHKMASLDPNLISEIRLILTTSGKKLSDRFKDSALSRARPFGLKRNALILIANLKIEELRPEVETLLASSPTSASQAKLQELAQWTLSQLTT